MVDIVRDVKFAKVEDFLANVRMIRGHRNKLDVPLFPEDKLQMAFLDAKYEQFWLHLVKEKLDLNMVKKVIRECYNQLQNGDEVFKFSMLNPALFDTIYYYMQNFTTDSEDPYREYYDDTRVLASMCFKQFCKVLIAKEKLHVCKYIEEIPVSFQDDCEEVRINVYMGLIYYAQSRYGVDSLLSNGIFQKIIKKIAEEKSMPVLNLILILCNEILGAKSAPQIALQNELLLNLKLYVDCELYDVLENTILNYGSISLCEDGKKKCVEEGTLITKMISKLRKYQNEDRDLKILIASTRFLMSASILKRGKVEIFELNGLDICFDLLNGKFNTNDKLVLDILMIISNVAEEPRARKLLLTHEVYFDKINTLLTSKNDLISQQARMALNIIKWEP